MTLRFDVVTIFPEMFAAVTAAGITRRALERGLWQWAAWNPRDWADNAYRRIDDRPFGGGPGMVMLAEPLEKAIAAAQAARAEVGEGPVIYLSPQGRPLTHRRVCELAATEGAILLCGRYEGIDERLIDRCVDEEISLGDFVLSGGEIAAMALMDACVRQLPSRSRLPRVCWIVRITRGRKCMKVVRCPKFCCRGTMKMFVAGVYNRRWGERGYGGRSCWPNVV